MVDPVRRALLGAAALGPVAAGVSARAVTTPPMVDCHLHCFDGRASARFPYHGKAPYRPDKALSPELALSCFDAANVGFGVLVHPEPYQEDHRYLEHCLQVGKGRLKGTCLFFADRPGWQKALLALAKTTPLSAFRVHAYAAERLPPFGKALRALWKAGAELGLIAQIHFEPHYLPGFLPLIEEFKNTPVVIDNLGRPALATSEEYAAVLRLARFRHVHMKLSALPDPEQYPFRPLAPMIKEAVAAFGPERLVWGGVFGPGSTPESFRAGVETIRGHIKHLGPAAEAAIMGGTAARLFGFAAT